MRSVEVSSDTRVGTPAPDGGVFEGFVARVVGERRRLSRVRRAAAEDGIRAPQGGAERAIEMPVDAVRSEILEPTWNGPTSAEERHR
jgi:hypothetical protein